MNANDLLTATATKAVAVFLCAREDFADLCIKNSVTAIQFFNSLMHGVDVTTIMRWDMPWWETILGVIEIFVLGWLFGALIACCYNVFGELSSTEVRES